ncbi:hypothetical protein AAY473_023888 [Plecturocebus cupreus]
MDLVLPEPSLGPELKYRLQHVNNCFKPRLKSDGSPKQLSTEAHTCNPSTLGGRGGQITSHQEPLVATESSKGTQVKEINGQGAVAAASATECWQKRHGKGDIQGRDCLRVPSLDPEPRVHRNPRCPRRTELPPEALSTAAPTPLPHLQALQHRPEPSRNWRRATQSHLPLGGRGKKGPDLHSLLQSTASNFTESSFREGPSFYPGLRRGPQASKGQGARPGQLRSFLTRGERGLERAELCLPQVPQPHDRRSPGRSETFRLQGHLPFDLRAFAPARRPDGILRGKGRIRVQKGAGVWELHGKTQCLPPGFRIELAS